MSIGNRIKEFIVSKNLSVKEFAESIDMTYENLYAYLSGTREPGAIVLKRLFEAGADLNYILMGEYRNVQKDIESKLIKVEKVLGRYELNNLNELEELLKKHTQIKKVLTD